MNKHLGRRSGRATPSSPPHLASTPLIRVLEIVQYPT
jgi:hypothetical protein